MTPMRVPSSSHYSWHHCFLPQKKRSNSLDCSCLKLFLWLMKIVPGCIYMWLAPRNFHVKQAAILHGNTAAHSACHAHHCNYQSHFGHAQYMKAHSNLPNHDTWNHYAHNHQSTVRSRNNDGVPRSSISLEQQKTINTIPFNSLIEQCLMEEQELISQLIPPTIHSTQHPANGHSVAPPAKKTPQTNPLFEQWLFEDQFHDSDLEPTHSWDDDYQKVNMYYKAKWPNGSPPHQNNGFSQTSNESDESTQN